MDDLFLRVSEYYRPSVPIDDPEMFMGRIEEKSLLLRTLITPGRHALIYGLRGIGKTSLINIAIKYFFLNSNSEYQTIRHTCSFNDNYESILFSVLNSLNINQDHKLKTTTSGKLNVGFKLPFIANAETEGKIQKELQSEKIIQPKISPNYFYNLIENHQLLIIIDEFDRISDNETILLFSETLKILSDKNSKTKIILAGVANSSNELFGGHLSLNRNLINLQLPLMNDNELVDIINYGANGLNLTFEPRIMNLILWLSDGMPFFTHLLAEELASNALFQNEKKITSKHLYGIIKNILKSRTYEIINHEYELLISENKKPIFDLNYYGDHIPNEFYTSKIIKLVLHSFSFIKNSSSNNIGETLKIMGLLYPKTRSEIEISDLEFETLINSTLNNFIKRDKIIYIHNDVYHFKDNFYKTFVRLKAISEIETVNIKKLIVYLDKKNK